MIEDKQEWAELLSEIKTDEKLVWIGVGKECPAIPAYETKTGWLRFIGEAKTDDDDAIPDNLVAGTLPARSVDGLMSGEWIDGNVATRAKLTNMGLELRTITETDTRSGDATPALRQAVETLTRAVPGDAALYMQIAIYAGFRTQADFEEGRLTTIAERFIGFSALSLHANEPLEETK